MQEPKEGRSTPAGARSLGTVVAENVKAYRLLRDMTQDELGARMEELGHGWSGGTVGLIERRTRHVAVDELGGLAIALGVTLGQLQDPTGPDHSRRTSLDVGLWESEDGSGNSIGPWTAQLWTNSRMVIRVFHGQWMDLAFEPAPQLHPMAQRELDNLIEKGEIRPMRDRAKKEKK